MESKDQPYVIISRAGELVILSTGRLDPETYVHHLSVSGRESDRIVFSEYGISGEGYKAAIEALGDIHEKPFSEVSEKVEGLVRKLERETQ